MKSEGSRLHSRLLQWVEGSGGHRRPCFKWNRKGQWRAKQNYVVLRCWGLDPGPLSMLGKSYTTGPFPHERQSEWRLGRLSRADGTAPPVLTERLWSKSSIGCLSDSTALCSCISRGRKWRQEWLGKLRNGQNKPSFSSWCHREMEGFHPHLTPSFHGNPW